MEKDGLVFGHITEYMRKVRRERTGPLGDLEREARREGYPISEPETADLLEILCLLKRPKKILEIGTCVGFSALLMASACPDAKIVTIERNPAMIEPAKANFARFAADNITLMEGQAATVLRVLDGDFDLIYLDAAKGQYPAFLQECRRLLSDNGVLIADNVLFNGWVAKGKADVHRNVTIVNRLDEFIGMLERDYRLKTVILPISDGVTVSYKMEEGRNV